MSRVDRLHKARLRRALTRAYPQLTDAITALTGDPDPHVERLLDALDDAQRLHRGGLTRADALNEAGALHAISPDTLRGWLRSFHPIFTRDLSPMPGENIDDLLGDWDEFDRNEGPP